MIHKFSMNGVNVVLDVNSGAVHVVEDIVYDIVDSFHMGIDYIVDKYSDKYAVDKLKEAIDDLNELSMANMIFTKDIYENVVESIRNREPVVKALCLHVAHDCNLKCKYCFAEEGEYHGRRSLMSVEVGKLAIDFIIKNSGERHNLEVDFFGGEPLLNFDVVKELVKYGREQEKIYNKNFRFTITTNGVLLDKEKQKFINDNMQNVVLSLDGRKEINDSMRPRAGGQGSYDDIVPLYQDLAKSRRQKSYYVRGTFTRHNMDFGKDIMHIADLGFKQISVEPVVSAEEQPYSIRMEDLPKVYDEYERLALDIYNMRKNEEKSFDFFHFNIDLSGGPCVAKRLSGCGCGTEYLAVTPEGDLYPCHQFVGMDEFKMGTVYEGVKRSDIYEDFTICDVSSKEECKNCWAKFYCSGGCAANAYQFNNTIFKPYEIGCLMQKKRVECAIMIKAKELYENA